MRKAGGIIALISGIFGFLAAIITLFMGGLTGGIASAFDAVSVAEDAQEIITVGWGAVFFSFGTIILGAIQIGVNNRIPAILLIACSIAGIVLGNILVAVCLFLSLTGGVLGLFGKHNVVYDGRTSVENIIKNDVSKEKSEETSKTWTTKQIFKTSFSVFLTLIILIMIYALIMVFSSNNDNVSSADQHALNSGTLDDYIPDDQRQFIAMIGSMRSDYKSASNNMAKGQARNARKSSIIGYFRQADTLSINGWVGKIESLESTNEGRGKLKIQIGDDISVTTFSKIFGMDTTLAPNSSVLLTASSLAIDDVVKISGNFIIEDDGEDAIVEESFGQSGAMIKPKFGFQFQSIIAFDPGAEVRSINGDRFGGSMNETFSQKGVKSQSQNESVNQQTSVPISAEEFLSMFQNEDDGRHYVDPGDDDSLEGDAAYDESCNKPYPCRLQTIIDHNDWKGVLSALAFGFESNVNEKIYWTGKKNGHKGHVQLLRQEAEPNCKTFRVVSIMGDKTGAEDILACREGDGFIGFH